MIKCDCKFGKNRRYEHHGLTKGLSYTLLHSINSRIVSQIPENAVDMFCHLFSVSSFSIILIF